MDSGAVLTRGFTGFLLDPQETDGDRGAGGELKLITVNEQSELSWTQTDLRLLEILDIWRS